MRAIPREVGGRSFVTPRIRSIVVGSLLGDAYVYPNGTLQVEQSWGQRAYVSWKYEQLLPVAGKPPRQVQRLDRRSGKRHSSFRFYSRAVFRPEREEFYAEDGKHVPVGIDELLDPTALAVWYMDDGGRGGRTPLGMVWNVTSFDSDDRERLRLALANVYGIETTLQTAGNGIHLYVRSASAPRLIEVIKPEIIPSMLYKLPLDPVTT